ncbi:uncharacterized protein BJ212DRAFT_1396540 [Suillus subaureus]|uniref:Uncharacterized protein n=1 Tax=Suillus subaureus TaxID=48587 RepID=A0A9P7DUB9_9AGAM|nr:uncharacterized protein BJ212DRAFT_1396540 [Suillus subaureus]KAG1803171.1 hypothetical protein BJ212DRAFT_1396540 [Suillus subaureus]
MMNEYGELLLRAIFGPSAIVLNPCNIVSYLFSLIGCLPSRYPIKAVREGLGSQLKLCLGINGYICEYMSTKTPYPSKLPAKPRPDFPSH